LCYEWVIIILTGHIEKLQYNIQNLHIYDLQFYL